MAYSATHENMTTGKQSNDLGSAASDIADDISGAARRVTGNENVTDTMSRHGRDAAENAQAVASNLRAAVDKSIQDQPMTTLIMAAAAGFLVGALWRS